MRISLCLKKFSAHAIEVIGRPIGVSSLIRPCRVCFMEFAERAVARFREIFGAEAEVEILAVGPELVKAKFGGNMCYTCGTYDYFEDFAYILGDEAGEEWAVSGYEQLDGGEYVVEFRPRRLVGRAVRHVRIVLDGSAFDLRV